MLGYRQKMDRGGCVAHLRAGQAVCCNHARAQAGQLAGDEPAADGRRAAEGAAQQLARAALAGRARRRAAAAMRHVLVEDDEVARRGVRCARRECIDTKEAWEMMFLT